MVAPRPLGRNAASLKYDLLAALSAHALAATPANQTLALRLIALITARYNWQRDEVVIGHLQLATLWSVTERTVKREMAKLKTLGWLTVLRPGARGRVTAYRLHLDRILSETSSSWHAVGPDFAERLTAMGTMAEAKVLHVNFTTQQPVNSAHPGWTRVLAALAMADPALHENWFRHLTLLGCEARRLSLTAPTTFMASYVARHHGDRLLREASAVFGPLDEIAIAGGDRTTPV
ncbi:MAG: DnaA N-terminal domain-containing protein [Pseudomonadota bacterium]